MEKMSTTAFRHNSSFSSLDFDQSDSTWADADAGTASPPRPEPIPITLTSIPSAYLVPFDDSSLPPSSPSTPAAANFSIYGPIPSYPRHTAHETNPVLAPRHFDVEPDFGRRRLARRSESPTRPEAPFSDYATGSGGEGDGGMEDDGQGSSAGSSQQRRRATTHTWVGSRQSGVFLDREVTHTTRTISRSTKPKALAIVVGSTSREVSPTHQAFSPSTSSSSSSTTAPVVDGGALSPTETTFVSVSRFAGALERKGCQGKGKKKGFWKVLGVPHTTAAWAGKNPELTARRTRKESWIV